MGRPHAVDLELARLLGRDDLGAELFGLAARRRGELGTGNAQRKAQVVLDLRTATRLPAGGGPLDQNRLQPLRCAVHRGGQACGTAADHCEVVHLQLRTGRQAEQGGQLDVRRLDEGFALLGDDDGQSGVVEAGGFEQLLALRLIGIDGAERVLIARQELPHLPRPLAVPVDDDLGVRASRGRRRPATPRAGRRSPGTASPPADPMA